MSTLNGTVTWIRFWLFTLQRKFAEALAVVEKFPNETLAIPGATVVAPKAFFEGIDLLASRRQREGTTRIGAGAPVLGTVAAPSARRSSNDTRTMASSLRLWVKKRKPLPKVSARSNCYPNLRTPLTDRNPPFRSHKFMPGPASLMKHSACSIICSPCQAASRCLSSSSIPSGIRCAPIRVSKNSARKSSREPCAISVNRGLQRANDLDC